MSDEIPDNIHEEDLSVQTLGWKPDTWLPISIFSSSVLEEVFNKQ